LKNSDYKLLKNIFTDFKVDDEEVPVEYIKYKGSKKTYITYTFIGDGDFKYADNKELGCFSSVDIDIYSDKDYLAIEDKVVEIMENNEFIRNDRSPDMYEEDTGLFHITIEFKKERMR